MTNLSCQILSKFLVLALVGDVACGISLPVLPWFVSEVDLLVLGGRCGLFLPQFFGAFWCDIRGATVSVEWISGDCSCSFSSSSLEFFSVGWAQRLALRFVLNAYLGLCCICASLINVIYPLSKNKNKNIP